MSNITNSTIGGGAGSSGGGISGWDPVLKPDYIKTGKNKAPGIFVLDNDFNGTIDDISPSVKGTIVYFFKATKRWGIISGEDKNKGVFPTLLTLQTALPTSTDGDYALVVATGTFFAYYNDQWNDTGNNIAPDALRATNNLDDLTDKAAARLHLGADSTIESNAKLLLKKDKITPITNYGTFGSASETTRVQVNEQGDILSISKQPIAILSTQVTDFTEASQDAIGGALLDTATIDFSYDDATNKISSDVKDLSLTNSKIATNAGIDTSKSKQTTITPVLARPQDGNTQEQINNSSLGLIDNLQTQIDTRPIGASNGSVYYLTSQSSAIENYELLSFSPDPSALDIESVTINSTTAKASRLIHSYIANYEIGSAIVNGGNWLFNFYGYVSHLNSSRFEIDIVKRAGATETLLFTCETTDFLQIAQVSPELNIVNVETTQQDFSCSATDKIVIKIYGKTDRTQYSTITLLHSGTDYASHIHTPLIVTHNNLVGVQGGSATEKYHLTLADYNKVGNLDNLLLAKEDVANKASSFSGTPANIKYPTEKLVKDNLDLKENLTNKASAFSAIPADVKYTTEKLVKDNLDLKVEKVAGKSLSTNDYTTAEQTKLAGITAGATVNSTDATLLARANHTGTQAISTIVDLSTNLSDKFSKTASNEITGLTDKTTITDADVLMIDDVADTGKKKKVSALNAYNYINNKLQTQFNNKVGISNTETIDGIKTFSSNITITAIPTLDNHSARLKDVNLKATSLAFRQESVRFIEATYGLDVNNGYSPDKPFQTVQAGWNDVNPGGQVKVQGASTYNVGTFTFNASKSSIKTILDNGAKITGTINLVAGNSSMQFFDGKISATINDGAGSTCYFTNVDISGSTLNFSNGGYKFIGNSTSTPAVINLTGTGGTLVLQDITGGIVPLNIGAGWTVVYYNCTPGILSNAGIIIDGLNIPINALIADQATLNAILAQTSSAYFGYYIVNFDSPVITGMTIAKGDVFYKVSATGNAKVYSFGNAPASFSLVVSTTQRSTVVKSVDKWVVAGTSNLILGETSSDAYRGDRGKVGYDHSQTTGNPHSMTKADIALENVPNVDATNPANINQTATYRFASDAEKTAWNAKQDSLAKSGNKYKVVRLNAGETANYYDFAVPSLTTTERDNLVTPATGFIIYNSTDDKLQRYSGTAWGNIIAAGTGSVVPSLGTGNLNKIAIFNTDNGTQISYGTNTASQRQSTTAGLNIIATYTSAERDTLTWTTGAAIWNSTLNLTQYYNGTAWISSKITSISTTAQTLALTDNIVIITPNSQATSFAITLADPNIISGVKVRVMLPSSLTTPNYGCTLNAPLAKTVGGLPSFVLTGAGDFVDLVSNGTDWLIFDKKPLALLLYSNMNWSAPIANTPIIWGNLMSEKYSQYEIRFKAVNAGGVGTFCNNFNFVNNTTLDTTANYSTGGSYVGASFQAYIGSPFSTTAIGGATNIFNFTGSGDSVEMTMIINNPMAASNKTYFITGSYTVNGVRYTSPALTGIYVGSSLHNGLAYTNKSGTASGSIEIWAIK